jgi:hypothetical protein
MSHQLPQSEAEAEADAKHYATVAFAISGLVVGLGMAFLQYLLFRIRYFTSKTRPTTPELSCLVATFWIVHYLVDEILSTLVNGYMCFWQSQAFIGFYGNFRGTTYNLKGAMGWGTLSLLIHEVAGTWFVFQTLTFIINTGVPTIVNLLRDHRAVRSLFQNRFQNRLTELVRFAHDFNERGGWTFRIGRGTWAVGQLKYVRRYFDVANFERNYIVGLTRGDRTLIWNFTVDQSALDEIKEIFGIIGLFGELGFTVTGNQVSFAAMGRGATVNIVFELEEDRLESIREEERMKSA